MENGNGEQMEVKAQPVATEEIKGEEKTEISLGKFKDVNALLSAYNSLQSEFTKRCQRIKELEGNLSAIDNQAKSQTESTEDACKSNDNVKDETLSKEQVIKEYLKGLLENKQTAIIMESGGVGLKTPTDKPKSIAEAGKLAKEILKK